MGSKDWYGSLVRRKAGSRNVNRTAGDLARDREKWAEAAAAYRRHLVQVPDDFAIWVQLGHSLKEQERPFEAVTAYQRAVALAPNDHDVRLHLAHLWKRIGNGPEAAAMFAQLFKLTGDRESYLELAQMSRLDACDDPDVRRARTMPGDALFIEVDDLLGFLEAHQTVSGIQRVQLGVIQHVLSMPDSATQYVFVVNETGTSYLWKIDWEDIGAIARYLREPSIDHDELRALVRRARRVAEAVLAQRGQAYLVLGAFWGHGISTTRYTDMKRAGVMVGAYIHDLIPITHAEYCDETLAHDFKLSFGDGLAAFDFLVAVSEFTAGEVRRYVDRVGLPARPIIAVPLAHVDDIPPLLTPQSSQNEPEPNLSEGTLSDSAAVHRSKMRRPNRHLARLNGRRFAMMVSTIEGRKNHHYLVAAWKQFVDEGLDPPDLVFVGRQGWRVTSLMEMLTSTRYLDGRIHLLHDLSDADLAELYDKSLFTLFPSFVEGWGLPVGESLVRGKPCVASCSSSIPEVGGDLVDYIDPLNLRDGIEVIRRMAFDTAYREHRTDEIRARFKARTWSEMSANLLGQVAQLRATLNVNTQPEVLFPSGQVFRPGDLALGRYVPDTYFAQPLRLMLAKGWYAIEAPGCWMRDSQGELLFRSDMPDGTPITIYVGLYAALSASKHLRLTVTVNDPVQETSQLRFDVDETAPAESRRVIPGAHFTALVESTVGRGGLVHIRLKLFGPVKPESSKPGSRRYAIGFASIGYAAADSVEARLQLVERVLLGTAAGPVEYDDRYETDQDQTSEASPA